ncbi:MAG: universal stress protein [Sedimentitalea sp.]|uniref:universal stress protein n=1 Tax=Sedimentitalea sp. TaxID=2048915 RepID=UPI0032674C90
MYDDIMLPVDPESVTASSKAIETAVRIAQDYGATLHILSVIPRLGRYAANIFPEDFAEENADTVKRTLEQIGSDIALQTERLRLHVATGSVYDEIITLSRKAEIDLIVLASHRPELSDYLLGPNAARVVRHADCSVMVVRG